VPPLTGRELLDFKSIISGIDADLQQYEEAAKIFTSKKPDCGMAKKVRVLLTGVPIVHGAERVLDIIEQNGGLVVCMENCTGIKPILEDVDETAADPIYALAKKYYNIPCSVMTKNNRRFETLRELIKQYRPQCVIELIWQACLTYDVESHFVRQFVQQECKLPYLRIETDYSPSDSPRIAVRVEALFETLRSRSGACCK
jgi:benzoyl-CoA reductase/2-hydroxyglutaryl-CoA dehydratase subunit BcrC/BadD/HgdB